MQLEEFGLVGPALAKTFPPGPSFQHHHIIVSSLIKAKQVSLSLFYVASESHESHILKKPFPKSSCI